MATTQDSTRPPYIAPKVRPYSPTLGDYVTRPIGSGETLEISYDPWAVQTGQATFKYGLASLHPTAQPALKFLTEGPFWSDFSFHPANDYERNPGFESVDKNIIALINYQVENFKYETFKNSLKSIWKDSLTYGFSIAEMNFKFDGVYTCLESIKTQSPFLFDLYSDQGNNLAKIYYRLQGQFISGPLLDKFLVTTYPYIEHGKHYGTSIMQSVYFDIKLVEILEQAFAEGVRSLAIKPIIHHFLGENLSEQDLTTVQNSLFNLDSGALVSLPATQNAEGTLIPQHDIKVLEDRASPEGTELIQNLLDILYKRINRSLGLPDDLGFSSTNIGSLAKAKEEMNLYLQTIVNNQEFIESFVNRNIVPAMVKYNYPNLSHNMEYSLPVFKFDTVEEDADATLTDNMIKLISAGILDPVKDATYIRATLNLPQGDPGIQDEVASETDESPVTAEGVSLSNRSAKSKFKRLIDLVKTSFKGLK